jgi:dTDP-4-amino-4,6-dideoxygalactose transaminase
LPADSLRIPLFKVFLPPRDELIPALEAVLYSRQISEGPPVAAFEEKFAREFDLPACLSLSSGTAALHVALILAGVGPGDEVISTPMTAEPTNMAIRHAGGRIVWADVDPSNGTLAAESIAARITPRTRAIMVVHYAGIPASLRAIRAVADAHRLPVIEDAAHALGARYDGHPIGTHSEFVMFSLQAIKHMTTVDGGILVCRSPEATRRGRLIRWFGIDRSASRTEVDVPLVGFKYHMNNVTATIGLAQLPHVRAVIERHVANGIYYDAALKGMAGLEMCRWDLAAEPSYWLYSVLAERRDDLIRRLAERGIAASTVHRRNDWHSVFADSRCPLPGLDTFYARMVHLPCGWWVTDEDRDYIVDTIRQGW